MLFVIIYSQSERSCIRYFVSDSTTSHLFNFVSDTMLGFECRVPMPDMPRIYEEDLHCHGMPASVLWGMYSEMPSRGKERVS
jgi:hypothetical protein